MCRRRHAAHAFTLAELLTVLVIAGVLLTVFVPYVLQSREQTRRVACQSQLAGLFGALNAYAAANDQDGVLLYPRTVFDPAAAGWTAYTGAFDADPFATAPEARRTVEDVAANDVTASLWLLVRGRYAEPAAFVCPSTYDRPDPLSDRGGERTEPASRGNFAAPNNLSYSYANPFGAPPDYRLSDTLPTSFALMADMNPGINGHDDVTAVSADASLYDMTRANSNNHGEAGQNVLFAAGTVEWQPTPFAGHPGSTGLRPDNIFTALQDRVLAPDESPANDNPGVFGRAYGPSWVYDSYLVPADD
ncbi:MAG: type II secretion system protein [Phycisphaerae bacterium]